MKRPEVPIEELAPLLKTRLAEAGEVLEPWVSAMNLAERLPAWVRNEMKTVETEIKYSGYLDQQRRSMEKMTEGGEARDSGVVRLQLGERAVDGDEADSLAGEAADAGAGKPYRGGDAGGDQFDPCLH